MRGLPIRVIQQLVRYYGDWRCSRDVISRLDESGAAAQPAAGRNSSGGASGYFHTLRSFYAR